MSPRRRRPLHERKPSGDADASTRQVRSKPRPATAATLPIYNFYGGGSSADDGEDWDAADVAVRAFPELKPCYALAVWTKFLNIAKACLGRYNAEHQDVHFIVHKRTRAFGYGLLFLKEPDDSTYYHLSTSTSMPMTRSRSNAGWASSPWRRTSPATAPSRILTSVSACRHFLIDAGMSSYYRQHYYIILSSD